MPHSVKIEDKTYEKLSLYCKDNGVKISDFCNRAIKDALMMKMYGDAPFYFYKASASFAEVDNHPKNQIIINDGYEIENSVPQQYDPDISGSAGRHTETGETKIASLSKEANEITTEILSQIKTDDTHARKTGKRRL